MAKMRFKLNRGGVRDLLRGPQVLSDLRSRASRVAAAAGPGHRVEVGLGPNRARAAVITDTMEARRAEATDRSLTRAIDAGRG